MQQLQSHFLAHFPAATFPPLRNPQIHAWRKEVAKELMETATGLLFFRCVSRLIAL